MINQLFNLQGLTACRSNIKGKFSSTSLTKGTKPCELAKFSLTFSNLWKNKQPCPQMLASLQWEGIFELELYHFFVLHYCHMNCSCSQIKIYPMLCHPIFHLLRVVPLSGLVLYRLGDLFVTLLFLHWFMCVH